MKLRQRQWSNRRIAEALSVDETTVRRDLESGAANAAPDEPDRIVGSDGKNYPAREGFELALQMQVRRRTLCARTGLAVYKTVDPGQQLNSPRAYGFGVVWPFKTRKVLCAEFVRRGGLRL